MSTVRVTVLALALAGVARAAERPDILLIMPDQMRGDCLSAVGHPVVRTPNLDALAQQGVLFRRAYSTVPSCIPARYALLTGLSPQASGVVGFKSRKIRTPTLPDVLGNAGYATVLVGRNMHQAPPNHSVGYQKEILGSTYVDHDAYDKFLREAAPQSGGITKLVAATGVTFNWWQAHPWPLADELHPTAWVARQAEKAVADAPAGKPLFLTASFYAPHPPLFAPGKFFNALLDQALPEPAHGDWVDWTSLSPTGSQGGTRIRLEGDLLKRAQAGYYGLIEQIDMEIAPLVAAFKARSEKAGRPWLIVFTSDHGEMMGDHGYFRKCEPYEGAANIPFIFAGAADLGFKPGLRPSQPAALEDILPTLLALANVPAPAAVDGVNLLPVLRDAAMPTRDILHSEHAPIYTPEQAFHALTDGRFKYIWRPVDGAEQLFDLVKDPREVHDLSKGPDVAIWRQRLIEKLKERPEGFTNGRELIPGRAYAPIMKGRT